MVAFCVGFRCCVLHLESCVFSVVVFCVERGGGVEIHMVESSSAYKLQPWRFSHERKRELLWLRLEKEREMTWERRDGR